MSAWDLLVVAGLTLLGSLYLAGRATVDGLVARRTRLGAAAFWTGWLAMLAAVLPPIAAWSLQRFSIHMIQHELLMLVGAPLVVAGRPLATAMLALPPIGVFGVPAVAVVPDVLTLPPVSAGVVGASAPLEQAMATHSKDPKPTSWRERMAKSL